MRFRFLSLHHLQSETVRVFLRFPLTFLIVSFATALSMVLIQMDWDLSSDAIQTHLLLTCILGIPLSLTFHLLAENKPEFLKIPSKWLPYLSLVPMIVYYIWFSSHDGNGDIKIIRFFHWALYCHLAVAIAPMIGSSSANSFWNFNYRIFLSF